MSERKALMNLGKRIPLLSALDIGKLTLPNALRKLWLLLLLAGLMIVPALLQPIERIGHDVGGEFIYRGLVFSEALSEGVLYPRWVQFVHLGLGGPLFTFQAPLPYYGMDLLYRLGIPHPIGWRVLIALAIFTGCAGMYLLVREITRRPWPAVVAAVAFIYAPYAIHNIFDRGSNEAYSMLLYPLVLWSLLWLARRPSGTRFAVASLAWAGCIGFHVLGPLMLAPVAGLMGVVLAWRYRTPAPLLALLTGGLLLTAVWAPILSEMEYVLMDQIKHIPEAQPANNPIPMEELFAPPAVFDVMRDNNGVGYQAGWLHIAAILLGLPALVLAWWQQRRELALFIGAFTLLGGFILWMMTAYSTPVWAALAWLFELLEFRYRLMGLLALAAAIVAGTTVSLLPSRLRPLLGIGIATLFVLTAIPSLYLEHMHRHGRFDTDVTLAEAREYEITIGGNAFAAFFETMPRWREAPLTRETAGAVAASPLNQPPETVGLRDASIRTGRWDLKVGAVEPTTLTLHLLYYPRWEARVNGKPVPVRPQAESGLLQLEIPAGENRISLRYVRTGVEQVAVLISLLALLVILLAPAREFWRRRQRQPEETVPAAAAPQPWQPPLWGLGVLTLLLLFKLLYVDPHTTWFRCASTETQVCGAQAGVQVPFERGPTLRGYNVLTPEVARGDTLRVNVIWQGEPELARLNTFVHVRRPGDMEILAQANNHTPGGLLTNNFVPGRLYLDTFRVPIPEDLPPGEYELEIGVYVPEPWEQLKPDRSHVEAPLEVYWRSVLLPPITVE